VTEATAIIDGCISDATVLLVSSRKATEQFVLTRYKLLMKALVADAMDIMKLHGIDERSPACYALEEAYFSPYSVLDKCMQSICTVRNQKIQVHAELKALQERLPDFEATLESSLVLTSRLDNSFDQITSMMNEILEKMDEFLETMNSINNEKFEWINLMKGLRD
jgi:hypothetical protein